MQEEASAFAKEFSPKEKKEDNNAGDEGDDADVDAETTTLMRTLSDRVPVIGVTYCSVDAHGLLC